VWLVDSNILIRAVSRPNHPLQSWLIDQLPAISVVTRIEVLGFHRLSENEEHQLKSLLSAFDEYPISDHTAYHAINLRKLRRMTLGDSLIAATCNEHGLILLNSYKLSKQ
jgi:toxin FitB